MQSTLVVDVLCIDVAFNGCWRSVHWTLTLYALLINTECFAWWCSAHWMLLLSALMLMLSALMLILRSLDFDALCIAWRCSAHWFWCCSQYLLWLRALVVDWCHQHWFLIDSYDKYWAGADTFVPFVAAYFNELVSSYTLTPPSCHSARRV